MGFNVVHEILGGGNTRCTEDKIHLSFTKVSIGPVNGGHEQRKLRKFRDSLLFCNSIVKEKDYGD